MSWGEGGIDGEGAYSAVGLGCEDSGAELVASVGVGAARVFAGHVCSLAFVRINKCEHTHPCNHARVVHKHSDPL